MASNIIRRGWYSWAAPAAGVDVAPPVLGTPTATGTTVTLPFNEALRAGPTAAQFTATRNGSPVTVNSAVVAGSTLTLTLASTSPAGHVIVVTYTPSATASQRLADNSRGNEVGGGVLATVTAT
jgi:uncharacterized repeat protein (TIGR02059 family)